MTGLSRIDRRWPDRPVLVAAGAAVGVLAAAVLTVVLLPAAEPGRPTAQPPPAIAAPVIPAPAGTAAPTATATPTPTEGFPTAAGAHTVSSRASKPSPPAPPPAGPPRLRPLSPAAERGLRSVAADRETAIEFVNARAEPVVVYWLDYGGRRVRYRVLAAGAAYRQHTYVTHPWVITRLGGRALAVFEPVAEPARATVV